jgi:excisionase family DNA binding protein
VVTATEEQATEEQREQLLTAEQAADRLHVHIKTLYRLVRQRRITVVRHGRRLLFTEYSIGQFIASNTHIPAATTRRRRTRRGDL